MCGLYGWQYNESAKGFPSAAQRGVIATVLADRMTSRGRDSCGYATAGADEEGPKVFFERATGTFERSDLFVKLIELTNIAAHTRYATVGAKTLDNAHPYWIGDIVGMHNGGIWNWQDAVKEHGWEGENYAVDSQVLLRHVADGLELGKLHGYGTIVWYDTRDMGAVYLCKLRNGDLEMEELSDEGGVLWASTRAAISDALLPLRMYRHSKAFNPRQGVVYRVAGGKIEETARKLELDSESWKHKPEKKSGNIMTAYDTFYGQYQDSRDVDAEEQFLPGDYYAGIKPEAWEDADFQNFNVYPKHMWYTADLAGQTAREYDVAVWRNTSPKANGLHIVPSRKPKNGKKKQLPAPTTPVIVMSDNLNAEERKRLGAMLASIESHREHCPCTLCVETFKLACRA